MSRHMSSLYGGHLSEVDTASSEDVRFRESWLDKLQKFWWISPTFFQQISYSGMQLRTLSYFDAHE